MNFYSKPHFDDILPNKLEEKVSVDVVCLVGISSKDDPILDYLKSLVKAPLGFKGEFSIAIFLDHECPVEELPAGVAMHLLGQIETPACAETVQRAKLVIALPGGSSGSKIAQVFGSNTATNKWLFPKATLETSRDQLKGNLCGFSSQEEMLDLVYQYLQGKSVEG